MSRTLAALLVTSAAVSALAVTASAAPLAGCALVTPKEANAALGGVFRIRLVEQLRSNVRECSIRVVRPPAAPRPYAVVRDWPVAGSKTAFDYTVRIFSRRKQPKGVRFVSFQPLKGLGVKAYTSKLIVAGIPRRSVLVWTGSNFIHAFNAVPSVKLPQVLVLARDAVRRT
jgi:hypothetical protein